MWPLVYVVEFNQRCAKGEDWFKKKADPRP